MSDGRSGLPVVVVASSREGRVDVGSFEVRERYDGPAPNGRFVVEGADHDVDRAVVAEYAERRYRRFSTPRILVVAGDAHQVGQGGPVSSLAECEDGVLGDERIIVAEQADGGRERGIVAAAVGDGDERLATHRRVDVGEQSEPI